MRTQRAQFIMSHRRIKINETYDDLVNVKRLLICCNDLGEVATLRTRGGVDVKLFKIRF